jgi:hypothetical protein
MSAVKILNSEPEMVLVANLTLHPKNPRRGDVDGIAESMRVNGWWGYLVAQRSTGHVLVGNHRLRAARKLKMKHVPVNYVDVGDQEAERIMIADNRMSDLGGYNTGDLAELLQALASTDVGLEGLGYSTDELEQMLADIEAPEFGNGSSAAKEDGGMGAAGRRASYVRVDWETFRVFHVGWPDDAFLAPYLSSLASFAEVRNGRGDARWPRGPKSLAFLDSGIITLSKDLVPGRDGKAVAALQQEIIDYAHAHPGQWDWVAMVDIPSYPEMFKRMGINRAQAMKWTIRNAETFAAAVLPAGSRRVMVAQSDSSVEHNDFLIESCERIRPFVQDDDVVAAGGLKTASDAQIEASLPIIRSYFPNNEVHLFGVTRPIAANMAARGLVNSVDSRTGSLSRSVRQWTEVVHKEGVWTTSTTDLPGWYTEMSKVLDQSPSLGGFLGYAIMTMSQVQVEMALRLQIREQMLQLQRSEEP